MFTSTVQVLNLVSQLLFKTVINNKNTFIINIILNFAIINYHRNKLCFIAFVIILHIYNALFSAYNFELVQKFQHVLLNIVFFVSNK